MRSIEWIVAPPLALGLEWTGDALTGITLDYAQGHVQNPSLTDVGQALALALGRYVHGLDPQWPDLDLDFDALPPFTGRVLRTLREQVGFGRTVSYGELAALAGNPNAARAVGRALARNPWPLVVPCHRVLGSDGSLTGFTNPSGLELKQNLLALEGARPRAAN